MTRRGVSLLELLVSLTLSALLAILAGLVLARSATVLRSRSERMALEQALRAATGVVREVVEPLGRDATGAADLVSISPTSFVARIPRAMGVVCEVRPAGIVVRAGSGWWSALRVPVSGRDSLLMYGLDEGAGWHLAGLSGPPAPDLCPDGSAALLLPAALDSATVVAVASGSPVRLFEPVELRAYVSSSNLWIGLRAVATGEAIQPLAGPFRAAGATLAYLRIDGTAAAGPAEVAAIRLALFALTEHAGGVGLARVQSTQVDSVAAFVTARNPP